MKKVELCGLDGLEVCENFLWVNPDDDIDHNGEENENDDQNNAELSLKLRTVLVGGTLGSTGSSQYYMISYEGSKTG